MRSTHHRLAGLAGALAASILTLAAPRVRADALADLRAATAASSPGGAVVTSAEADALVATAPAATADDAIRALVAAGAIRTAPGFANDQDYGRLLVAYRTRVAGLTPAAIQAPGVTFQRGSDGRLNVLFDRQRVTYARVDLIYTYDEWATTHAVTLGGRDVLAATLDRAPAQGTIVYALHVFGPDGREFWIANGREHGVYGGSEALDYRFPIDDAAARPVAASAPPLALLIHAFGTASSPDGATVTMGDFSLMVEELTFEGGSGIDDPRLLGPALRALDELVSAGAVFDAGIEDGMRGFVERQQLVTATYPGAAFTRGAQGQLLMAIGEAGATSAKVLYTTDGWQSPKVATCSGARLVCDLGAIPPGTLASYVVAVRAPGADWRWIRSVLGNFFQALP
jgi:hypothetical protein